MNHLKVFFISCCSLALSNAYAISLTVAIDPDLHADSVYIYKYDDYFNGNLKPWVGYAVTNNTVKLTLLPSPNEINSNIVYFSLFNKSAGYVIHDNIISDSVFIYADSSGGLKLNFAFQGFVNQRAILIDAYLSYKAMAACDTSCLHEFEKRCRVITDTSYYKTKLVYSVLYPMISSLATKQKNAKILEKTYHIRSFVNLENDKLHLNDFGYVAYLAATINSTMNAFGRKYPIKKYINRSDLYDFVFHQPLFKKPELETFAQFYKLYKLDRYNDTLLIHRLMDSLATATTNPAIQTIIFNYLGKASTDVSLTPIVSLNLAPQFMLKDAEGNMKRLSDYSGKYVLLDFWATWCGPCVKKMKEFPGIQKKYGGKLTIVSISVDDAYNQMVDFKNKNQYTWPFLYNGQDHLLQELYGVKGYPTYILINPKGEVVKTLQSFDELDTLLN